MTNHTFEIDQEIDKVHKAIQDARTLIDEQMDGPCTMRDALKAIEERLGNVETEASILGDLLNDMMEGIARMRKQRNETIRQRDYLLRNRGIWDDSAAWRRVIYGLEVAGYKELAEKIEAVIKP